MECFRHFAPKLLTQHLCTALRAVLIHTKNHDRVLEANYVSSALQLYPVKALTSLGALTGQVRKLVLEYSLSQQYNPELSTKP